MPASAREAKRWAGKLAPPARQAALDRLVDSERASREARRLWSGGELDGAMREAKRSVEMLLRILEQAEARPDLSPALGVALESDGGSRLEGGWDVDEHLRVLLDERRRLAWRARWVSMSAEDTTRTIRRRRMVRGLGLMLALVLVVLAFRTKPVVRATGSPTTQRNFEPIYAIDGNPRTEWQSDDHRNGWVELRLEPARSVGAVRVLNGHNRHYDDRGTQGYRVALYGADDEELASGEGSFETIRPDGEWQRLDIAARGVARVRVTAETWHGRSPAIAEIELEYRD